MATEKALALVLRTTDWSESSRIVTLGTRELGKVRAVAKGAKRLRSAFESALDLLTLCDIVLIRKSSGSLDLLTEARVAQRFPRLQGDLSALYAAYYVAELLDDWTQDNDPHPGLFDEALDALRELGTGEGAGDGLGARVMRFEMRMFCELGYRPRLDACAECAAGLGDQPRFSPAAGGLLCERCSARTQDGRRIGAETVEALRVFEGPGDAWRRPWGAVARAEMRQVLGAYVTHQRGKRPRLLPYLGS